MIEELIGRMMVSALIGGLIGMERELNGSHAGLRTHTLVALGACLFTLASITIGGNADIARIAGQVAVGLGFIGGGVIFRNKDKVVGLTTAADLWICGALGILAGIGQYTLAFAGTTLALVLLIGGKLLEQFTIGTKR
jgi:putative Mg2+ transporter-C (MgtC) family protein